MTTYYSDADIEISEEHIKLGGNTFQTCDVKSFDVRPMLLATLMNWRFLPFLFAFVFFAVSLLVRAVRLVDYFFGRGELPNSSYAQDWTDFLIPLALVIASLGMFAFSEVKAHLGVILRGTTGKLGSYTTSNAKLFGEITSALGSALKEVKLAQRSTNNRLGANAPNEVAFYSSSGAEVTDELVVLMGKEYRVSDIQEVRIQTEGGRSTVSLITSLVIGLLVIPTWVSQMLPLLSTQPVLGPSGIQFPVAWLMAVGFLAFTVTWIISMIRIYINKFVRAEAVQHTYVIMLWGRFGLQNREVILSTEAFRSMDKEETHKIAGAIEQAIAKKRFEMGTPDQTRPNSKGRHKVRRVAIAGPGGR